MPASFFCLKIRKYKILRFDGERNRSGSSARTDPKVLAKSANAFGSLSLMPALNGRLRFSYLLFNGRGFL